MTKQDFKKTLYDRDNYKKSFVIISNGGWQLNVSGPDGDGDVMFIGPDGYVTSTKLGKLLNSVSDDCAFERINS